MADFLGVGLNYTPIVSNIDRSDTLQNHRFIKVMDYIPISSLGIRIINPSQFTNSDFKISILTLPGNINIEIS